MSAWGNVSIAGRIDAKPRIEVMRSAMGEAKLTMAGGLRECPNV